MPWIFLILILNPVGGESIPRIGEKIRHSRDGGRGVRKRG
jgi:hypothetical protein